MSKKQPQDQLGHRSPRLYSMDEAGRQLAVSRARVYELAARGPNGEPPLLPTVLLGRLRRVRESDLQEFVDRLA